MNGWAGGEMVGDKLRLCHIKMERDPIPRPFSNKENPMATFDWQTEAAAEIVAKVAEKHGFCKVCHTCIADIIAKHERGAQRDCGAEV